MSTYTNVVKIAKGRYSLIARASDPDRFVDLYVLQRAEGPVDEQRWTVIDRDGTIVGSGRTRTTAICAAGLPPVGVSC